VIAPAPRSIIAHMRVTTVLFDLDGTDSPASPKFCLIARSPSWAQIGTHQIGAPCPVTAYVKPKLGLRSFSASTAASPALTLPGLSSGQTGTSTSNQIARSELDAVRRRRSGPALVAHRVGARHRSNTNVAGLRPETRPETRPAPRPAPRPVPRRDFGHWRNCKSRANDRYGARSVGEARRGMSAMVSSTFDANSASRYPRHFPPYYDRCGATHADIGQCELVIGHVGEHTVIASAAVLSWSGSSELHQRAGEVESWIQAERWRDA
jgi:hypothetical protein